MIFYFIRQNYTLLIFRERRGWSVAYGVVAYLSGYYLKEYNKRQVEKMEEDKLNLDVVKLRNELRDYGITKFMAKWAFIISIVTILLALVAFVVSIKFPK